MLTCLVHCTDNWLGTVFYISYILFQWTQMGWKHFKPHVWCTCVVFAWGFIASIQAVVFNWGGLMTCRFFLAIAEAAYGPGVPLYLSFFYPRERIGFRHGVFISGAAMANAYSGALAYGITQITGTIAPWKILFLIEGLPTCAFALIVWFALPDSVMSARFLTDREKQVSLHLVARNQRLDVGKAEGLRFKEVLEGVRDPKSWIPALCYFGWSVCISAVPRTLANEFVATCHMPLCHCSYPPSLRIWASGIRLSRTGCPRHRTYSASSTSIPFAGYQIASRCGDLSARYPL